MQSSTQPSLEEVMIQILQLGVEWGEAAQKFKRKEFASAAEARDVLNEFSNRLLDRGLAFIPLWNDTKEAAQKAGRILEPKRLKLVEDLLFDCLRWDEMRREQTAPVTA